MSTRGVIYLQDKRYPRQITTYTQFSIFSYEIFIFLKSRDVSINDATYQNDFVGPADDVKIHGATYDEGILDEIVSQQYTINEGLRSSVTVSSNVEVNVAQVITVQVMPSNSEHLGTFGSEAPIVEKED
jgi:hypothetical protein